MNRVLQFILVGIITVMMTSGCAQYWARYRAIRDIDPPPPAYAGEGTYLIDEQMPKWDLEWVQGETKDLIKGSRGEVGLVHFWMGDSQGERNTAMTLEYLWRKWKDNKEFYIVSVYCPGPDEEVSVNYVAALAKEYNITYAVAIDHKWETLNAYWRGRGKFKSDSATLLLDRKGRVRYLFPGPELTIPSDEPHPPGTSRAAIEFDQWIRAVLAEKPWYLRPFSQPPRIDH